MRFPFGSARIRLAFLFAVLFAGGAAPFVGCGDTSPPIDIDVQLPLEGLPDEKLKEHLDAAIEFAFRHRRLNTRDHAAWQIIHASIPFGRSLLIYDDHGRTVRAIDYVLDGGRMAGWTLLPGADLGDGRRGVNAVLEAGSSTGQGHKDQWLGYLAVSAGLPSDRRVMVRGEPHTIEDWLRQVKLDIWEGTERGWSLMALSRYYRSDEQWTAADNTTWTIDRVMATEAGADFRAGSCGGTHALSGMTIALLRYRDEQQGKVRIETEGPQRGKLVDSSGRVLDNGFARANDQIQEAIRIAKEYQQADGSFSNSYFQRAEHSNDLQDRLRKTGHVLEFLALALSDEELRQDWVRRAVIHLIDVLERTDRVTLECGALYHGMSGLALYRHRIFDERFGPLPYEQWAEEELASSK